MHTLTHEEYTAFAYRHGTYDNFSIDVSYELYLAMKTGDKEKIKKATNNVFYNHYYKYLGRLN